jgi:hypothetical protein
MLTFAAGIMLGGSIGAVVMGALVARVRGIEESQPSAPRLVRLHASPSTLLH